MGSNLESNAYFTVGGKVQRRYTSIYGQVTEFKSPCLYRIVACDHWGDSTEIGCFDWGNNSVRVFRNGAYGRAKNLEYINGCSHVGVTQFQLQYRLYTNTAYLHAFCGNRDNIWI